jgi:hypothetical protein
VVKLPPQASTDTKSAATAKMMGNFLIFIFYSPLVFLDPAVVTG